MRNDRSILLAVLTIAAISVVLLHTLLADRSLRLDIRREKLTPPIQKWLHASQDREGSDIAVLNGWLSSRRAHGNWNQIAPVDSEVVQITVSNTGRSVALLRMTRRPRPGQPGELKISTFVTTGRRVATWTRDWHYDRPIPCCVVNQDGLFLALGWADIGQIEILRPNESVVTVDLFADDAYGYERSLYLTLAGSGSTFFALATEQPAIPGNADSEALSAKPVLFEINSLGKIIRQIPLKVMDVTGLHLDQPSGTVVVGGVVFPQPGQPRPLAYLFDRDLSPRGRIWDVTPEFADFAPSEDRVVLADPMRAVCARLSRAEEMWRVDARAENLSVLQVAIVPARPSIALLTARTVFRGNRFVFENPQIRVFGLNGQEIGRAEFPETLAERPILSAFSDGSLRVLTQTDIWRFTPK